MKEMDEEDKALLKLLETPNTPEFQQHLEIVKQKLAKAIDSYLDEEGLENFRNRLHSPLKPHNDHSPE